MNGEFGNLQSFRKGIKLVDATLRDGGLVNNFLFPEGFAQALFRADVEAGVDIMEVGYRNSRKLFSPSEFGEWKFCEEQSVRSVVGDDKRGMKISVMADVGRADFSDLIKREQSVVDMYRIATYVNAIPAAAEMISRAHDLGYETCCNIMAISRVRESDLRHALEIVASTPVDVIYIVDSFGSLYPEEMKLYCDIYGEAAYKHGKQLGIHAHNNQQLAFANTIECVARGVNYLDATVSGLGRGAGNCPLEAMLGFLKNPRYKMQPVLKFIREHILPLRESGVVWGYDVPYLLTGLYNVHPRSAIQFIKDGRRDYEALMETITESE